MPEQDYFLDCFRFRSDIHDCFGCCLRSFCSLHSLHSPFPLRPPCSHHSFHFLYSPHSLHSLHSLHHFHFDLIASFFENVEIGKNVWNANLVAVKNDLNNYLIAIFLLIHKTVLHRSLSLLLLPVLFFVPQFLDLL